MLQDLHFEQEGSLANYLQKAGMEHGDIAEVVLEGVGIHEGQFGALSVAFCPTNVASVKIRRKGTAQERKKQIPDEVQISHNLQRRILKDGPAHGFVHLRTVIHSNGHIQLNGSLLGFEAVDPTICVHGVDSYLNYRDLLCPAE